MCVSEMEEGRNLGTECPALASRLDHSRPQPPHRPTDCHLFEPPVVLRQTGTTQKGIKLSNSGKEALQEPFLPPAFRAKPNKNINRDPGLTHNQS